MPTTNAEQRERAKKGIKARQDAIKTLIQNHQVEFDALHTRNRISLGLTPSATSPSREQLEERIKRNQAKLAKDMEMLRLVS